VNDLFVGLKDYGFIILVDHTVDTNVIKNGYSAVREFFNLPTEKKLNYICKEGGGQRGYTSFGVEHAKDSQYPDLKEFWHVGREVPEGHRFYKYYPKNMWPTEVKGFEESLSNLYNSLSMTAITILEALGMALDVPQNYFREMIEEGNSILRPIYYPPVGEAPPKGSVRAAAHEDINLITILMGATSSGLELLDRDGTWLPVETKEGQLVVDTGDMMTVLTNGVLPATTHRVVNPGDGNSERFSMPFFVHPHPEVMLEQIASCTKDGLKYQPINSHEYLMQRLKEIGLMK
jgi:isopenicillin N synthase-like dioxygenase